MNDRPDRINCEIIAALQKNARLSNKELAGLVGLAPSTCLLRVRHLIQQGVLKGFWTEVDPAALGIGLSAMIAVRLKEHSRAAVEAFRAHLFTLREVVSVYHLAGADDFLVHVAVRDAGHLRDLALDGFTKRSEVAHMQTSLLFEYTRVAALPNYGLLEEKKETGRASGKRSKTIRKPRA